MLDILELLQFSLHDSNMSLCPLVKSAAQEANGCPKLTSCHHSAWEHSLSRQHLTSRCPAYLELHRVGVPWYC